MRYILEGSRTRSIRMSSKIRDNRPDNCHQDNRQRTDVHDPRVPHGH